MNQHDAVVRSYSIPGQTWPRELRWIAETFRASRFHAEIGVCCGRSLFAAGAAMSAGATVFAIENDCEPNGLTGFPQPTNSFVADIRGLVIAAIEANGVAVQQLRMGSVDAARHMHKLGVRLDSVFIDADHSYEGVVADVTAWMPLIRPGGIIAGHDYWARHHSVMDAVNDVFRDGFSIVPETRMWHAVIQ